MRRRRRSRGGTRGGADGEAGGGAVLRGGEGVAAFGEGASSSVEEAGVEEREELDSWGCDGRWGMWRERRVEGGMVWWLRVGTAGFRWVISGG